MRFFFIKIAETYMKFELNPEHKGTQAEVYLLVTDQEMLYSYGVSSHKKEANLDDLTSNFHVGQTYRGMAMIEDAMKYFRKKAEKKK